MEITSVKHRGLKALIADTTGRAVRGLDPNVQGKIRLQIAAIQDSASPKDLTAFPGWKAHDLKPKRPDDWGLWVTGNWRLTFAYKASDNTAANLDYEDYHGKI